MKQLVAVIQARYGSTRLPGKVLRPLPEPDGPPLLSYVVKAASGIQHSPAVIVATTSHPSDDQLSEWCHKQDVRFFRGSVNDVLDRFIRTSVSVQAEHIVRLTGDNPFFDAGLISRCVERHMEGNYDYTYTAGYPTGTNVEIIRTLALEQSAAHPGLTDEDREHVTLFARKNQHLFKCLLLEAGPQWNNFSDWRLTVDTEQDFANASLIIKLLDDHKNGTLLEKLFALVKQMPWLTKLNQGVFQKRPGISFDEEIKFAADILRYYGLDAIAATLEKHRNQQSA